MESKYIIGLVVLAVAGVGVYMIVNRPAPPPPMPETPTSSDQPPTPAGEAARVIDALGRFGERAASVAMNIRNQVQRDTTAAEERQRTAAREDAQNAYYASRK